jgi:hypothetical protein
MEERNSIALERPREIANFDHQFPGISKAMLRLPVRGKSLGAGVLVTDAAQ